jgi:branched-chain amino acid transport system ATP-binding protein
MMAPLLEVERIETSYGRSQVLFGMSLDVGAGEVVTLMGRNGMGKTTTIRSILGLTRASAGSVRMAGVELRGQPCFKVTRHGIGIVPEGRQVFPNLSVHEHLLVAATNRTGKPDPWTTQKVYGLFPRLMERRGNLGNQLSGGEQQMLAIGRALMTNPRLLIFDEATEGLAPLVREEIWNCIEALKAEGQSILLVDKNLDALTRIADRHFIIEKGRVAWTGTSAELQAAPEMQHRYLGV